MNFNFGSPKTEGLTFGTTTPATAKPAAFSFGSTVAPAGGLGASPANSSFGNWSSPPNSTAPASNFSFAAAATAAPAPAFGFSSPTQQPAAAQPAALNFGQTQSPSFSFSTKPAVPAFGQTGSTLPFGQMPASNPPAFNAPQQPSTFSFGSNAASPGIAPNQNAANLGQAIPTASPGLSFGQAPATNAPSLGFGLPPASTAAPSLNFGGAPTSLVSGGLTFGQASSTLPVSTNTFGLAQAPAAIPSTASGLGGFNFAPSGSGPINFGSSTVASSAAQLPSSTPAVITSTPLLTSTAPAPTPAPINFGSPLQLPASKPAAVSGFSIPGVNVAASSSLSGTTMPLGAPTAAPITSAPAFTGFQVPASTAQPSFATLPKTTATGLILGAQSTAPTTTAGSSLLTALQTPAAVPPVATSGLSLSLSGFQLPASSTINSTAAGTSATTLPTSTTATTTLAQPAPVVSMTFGQLEESINKWSLELEEQEKVFINQATQVNAWDRLLIANADKIVTLNDTLQVVRTEQQSLEHELDFIIGQQRELEELLVPLEKELGNVTISDPEREHTYQLADNMDTQLKQMSEDLKEIIEHLNESNRSEDNNDPIVQIGRILNAHVSSMQWIDTSTAQISTKLDQLSTMHNTLRRDNERSFHLTYN